MDLVLLVSIHATPEEQLAMLQEPVLWVFWGVLVVLLTHIFLKAWR